MDVMRCMKANKSFSFVKMMLKASTLSRSSIILYLFVELREMKQSIMDTGKVEEPVMSIFDDYIPFIVFSNIH